MRSGESVAGSPIKRHLSRAKVSIEYGKDLERLAKDLGSGLGYCDLGSSIKKLAISIAECGFRNAEFKTSEKKAFSRRNLPRLQGKRGKRIRRIPHQKIGFRGVG